MKYLLLLLFPISLVADSWVHVNSTSKDPVLLSGNYFFEFENGFNPNDGNPFGPAGETMFLPVINIPSPPVNDVLISVTPINTNGVRGGYVNPNWEFGWTQTTQTLSYAKEIKLLQLETDQQTALDAGHIIGQFTLDFSEEVFQGLDSRYKFLDLAINEGAAPANQTLTFSDRDGKEVSVNLTQLKTNYVAYGQAYFVILEKAVNKRDAINAATTPAQVDAVTWVF